MAIIMRTGQSCKELATDALKAKADDYIEKPIKLDKFLETIRVILMAKPKKNFVATNGIHSKIGQAKQFIKRNFDKKISLEDVAGQLCLSPKYFSRIYKQITKEGFNKYRLTVKINNACVLLKQSDYTVSQIASRLGYQNLESFIRMFENTMKVSPGQYRRKNQKINL